MKTFKKYVIKLQNSLSKIAIALYLGHLCPTYGPHVAQFRLSL